MELMTPTDNPLEKYKVEHIRMDEILADEHFNCRGHIAPIDVIDLARDIADRGLDQPIVVRPWTEKGKPNIRFKVVAGHRRHMAFKVNRAETIPAYVRADLDELRARLLNFRENIQRKELNIKQEANALRFFLDYRGESGNMVFTENDLADIFGQSRGWVQVRKDLLKLPADIQDEAAAGILTQDQIKAVARIKNRDDQYALVRKIKEKKLRGEKVKLAPSVKRVSDVLKAKERKRAEIQEMLEIIYDITGPNLATRCLAWASGEISTAALYSSIQEYCEEQGIEFTMPKFINHAIMGIKEPA